MMQEQQFQATERLPAPRLDMECRVSERHSCALSTSCQPTSAWGSKESRWSGTILNISQGGIRLLLRRRFEPGASLAIELPGADEGDTSVVFARVVHAKIIEAGSWALGCKFVSALSEEELQRLLTGLERHSAATSSQADSAVPPISPSESAHPVSSPTIREAPGGGNTLVEVDLQLEILPGKRRHVRIKRLFVPEAWAPSADKILTMRGGTGQGPLPLLKLKILQCHLQGQRWTLQCQLLNPSAAPALLQTLDLLAAQDR